MKIGTDAVDTVELPKNLFVDENQAQYSHSFTNRFMILRGVLAVPDRHKHRHTTGSLPAHKAIHLTTCRTNSFAGDTSQACRKMAP